MVIAEEALLRRFFKRALAFRDTPLVMALVAVRNSRLLTDAMNSLRCAYGGQDADIRQP